MLLPYLSLFFPPITILVEANTYMAPVDAVTQPLSVIADTTLGDVIAWVKANEVTVVVYP